MNLKFTVLFFLLISVFNSFSQENKELNIEEQFVKGNELIKLKKFKEAIPIFSQIVAYDSLNANSNFKLGLCYSNYIPLKSRALNYFKKAQLNLNENYDFNNFDLNSAPFDVLFFIGDAYLHINEADSALNYFLKYSDHYNGNTPIECDRQIRWCMSAIEMVNKPMNVHFENMETPINSAYSETHPVFSMDEQLLAISSTRLRDDKTNTNLYDIKTSFHPKDIYLIRKSDSLNFDEIIYFQQNSDFNDFPLWFSSDNKRIYFASDRKGQFDIYYSDFKDEVWQSPKEFKELNSVFNEVGLTISVDGTQLWLSSDRLNEDGRFDIYYSSKNNSNNWSRPEKISINTEYNELMPYIHPTGKKLYFSSNGYKFGKGGYDIFYSNIDEQGKYSTPKSVAFPINTTQDDIFYFITGLGNRYTSSLNENLDYDIYSIVNGGFDGSSIKKGAKLVELTNDSEAFEVVELEKEIEKEVEVVEIMEVETIVEKEVEVTEILSLDEIEEGTVEEKIDENIETVENKENIDSISEKLNEEISQEEEIENSVDTDSSSNYLINQYLQNNIPVVRNVVFDFNAISIDKNRWDDLQYLVEFLKVYPEFRVEIIGFADTLGDFEMNYKISNLRANFVKQHLLDRNIKPNILVAYGKSNFSNNSEVLNQRRVEIILHKK